MHSPHFLQLLHLDPNISIAFAGSNGLNVLAASKYVIVDGTFDLVEEKLVLTTLMGYHDEIAVSCAYYLSKLKTHDSYLVFFVCYICFQNCCYIDICIENKESYQWTAGSNWVFVGL